MPASAVAEQATLHQQMDMEAGHGVLAQEEPYMVNQARELLYSHAKKKITHPSNANVGSKHAGSQ